MRENFSQIRTLTQEQAILSLLGPLWHWTERRWEQLIPTLQQRRAAGHIRECHGDLHLGNVALVEGEPVMFDAIEFNPGLRWIDTISDIAFMTMDLQERGRNDLAYRFLDRYLQSAGDYDGLTVLRFYEVYRALVRAKIAAIRCAQVDLSELERDTVLAELTGYIAFAKQLTGLRRGAVVITQGVSGSGKSHVSEKLPDFLPAVRLRSDIERKRLLGLDPHDDATRQGAYSAELTRLTYERLRSLANRVAASGYVAVVDATFLKHAQRDMFASLARSLRVPFLIIDCDAPVELLRERIIARREKAGNVSDADLHVLDAQLASREILTDREQAVRVIVRPGEPLDREEISERLRC
jgi:hypothetical protein